MRATPASWPARVAAAARDVPARAPGTFVYLLVLVVCTLVVRSTSETLTDELLRQVSTSLDQMSRSAGRVLFLSAFLLPPGGDVVALGAFVVVHATLERGIGTMRWLAVVVVGHVGATLVTTLGIWADVRSHRGTASLVHAIDVGPSYATMAAAGFLALGLARPGARIALCAGLAAVVVVPLLGAPTFTDVGHLTAAVLGAALWLVVPAGAGPPWIVSPLVRSSTRAARPGPARTAPPPSPAPPR